MVWSCNDILFQFWLFWILNDKVCQLLIGSRGGKYCICSMHRCFGTACWDWKVAFLVTISPVQYGIVGKGAGDLLRENQELEKLSGVTSGCPPCLFCSFLMKTIQKLRVVRGRVVTLLLLFEQWKRMGIYQLVLQGVQPKVCWKTWLHVFSL